MKLNTILLAGTATLVATGANAQAIFSTNFNNYQNGSSAASQSTTGLTVYAFGDLPGFAKGGEHSVHAVDRGAGDFAPMFYNGDSPDLSQTNYIATSLIGANVAGKNYVVTFDGAFGSYDNSAQQTQAGDSVLFSLFTGETTVTSYSYVPTSFTFTPASFSYVGTGMGEVNLFIAGRGNAGQFGGSIDNLSISAVPEPATWAMMVLGFGVVGFGLRSRRKVSTKVSFA